MKTKYLIIGAGIGGLATGAALKEHGQTDFLIVDKAKSLPLNLGNGVHYLHSNDFGTPFPFSFKKITCVEELWEPRTDAFKKTANVPEMIKYSMKVMGKRLPSSIMDPGNRQWETYLPESNNMNDLLQAYHDYIGAEHFKWNSDLKKVFTEIKQACFAPGEDIIYEHMITTAPLNVFHKMCDIKCQNEFKNNPLYITNYKTENIAPHWLISLYIADHKFAPYRITILNGTISMEAIKPMSIMDEHIVHYHLSEHFDYDADSGQRYTWETGRIFGLSPEERDKIVTEFSNKDIHLLGRFSRWQGTLLMDSTILQAKEIVNEICK